MSLVYLFVVPTQMAPNDKAAEEYYKPYIALRLTDWAVLLTGPNQPIILVVSSCLRSTSFCNWTIAVA